MVNTVGSADQQMAVQAGNGFSATPQGVEAQQAMVDITTNNYQKAIESFFSKYCSYALTTFFQELKGAGKFIATAETRQKLLDAGYPETEINTETGELTIDFKDMAVEYYVRCVPGSLVEMEDQKQLRLLNQLFVPLSQAMPALAAAQDQEALAHATKAMQFIIEQQIELSGSSKAKEIADILRNGHTAAMEQESQENDAVENEIHMFEESLVESQEMTASSIADLQEKIRILAESQAVILQKLGVPMGPSDTNSAEVEEPRCLWCEDSIS